MKRICIVTFYPHMVRFQNYGSLLQYYALQQHLRSVGMQPFLLAYERRKLSKSMERLRETIRLLSKEKGGMILLGQWRQKNEFLRFIRNNFSKTNRYHHYDQLCGNVPEADCYLCGSDQVWAMPSPVYYLRFVKGAESMKLSYAASFGTDTLDLQTWERVTPWLKDFSGISVREPSGIQICKSMGIPAQQHIDPVFLLPAEKYPCSTGWHRKYGNYMCCYFRNHMDPQDFDLKQFMAETKNRLDTVRVVATPCDDVLAFSDDLEFASPEQWLGLIKESSLVVTNSFHGTAFAILFHKPFITVMQSGQYASQNIRMQSLLESMGLTDRIYSSLRDPAAYFNTPIDWNRVDRYLDDQRKRTAAYFRENLF